MNCIYCGSRMEWRGTTGIFEDTADAFECHECGAACDVTTGFTDWSEGAPDYRAQNGLKG